MSFKTKEPGTTPWWARRRVLGSALAITALVASGAAANASANGDGFLNPPAGGTTTTGGTTSSSTQRGATPLTGQQNVWSWNGTSYNWNGNQWGWNGTGNNRFAFAVIANRTFHTFTQALGVNDRNVIVGFTGSGLNARNPNRPFAATLPTTRGGSSINGVTIPHAVQAQAVGINNAHVIVGFFVDRRGANHGFVLNGHRVRVVDFPGTSSRPAINQLLGINNFGTAAGFFNDRKGNSHGYLFNTKTGQFILLRLPVHTTNFIATGVNDRGQVTGFFAIGRTTRGFIWSHGQFIVLNLGHHTNTQALGINNAGVVVGSFMDARGRTHGFVRVNARLTRTVDVPGSTSTVVNGINNRGLIVGFFSVLHTMGMNTTHGTTNTTHGTMNTTHGTMNTTTTNTTTMNTPHMNTTTNTATLGFVARR